MTSSPIRTEEDKKHLAAETARSPREINRAVIVSAGVIIAAACNDR